MFSLGIIPVLITLMFFDPKTLLALPCEVDLNHPNVCVKAAFIHVCKLTLTVLVPSMLLLTGAESFVSGFTWKRAKKKFVDPFSKLVNGVKSIPAHCIKALPFIFLLILIVLKVQHQSISNYRSFCEYMIYVFAILLLCIGCGELLWNRKKHFDDLSMSMDEMRDEMKDSEGDPHVKAERKALHRRLSFDQAVAKIRQSKVVIVE